MLRTLLAVATVMVPAAVSASAAVVGPRDELELVREVEVVDFRADGIDQLVQLRFQDTCRTTGGAACTPSSSFNGARARAGVVIALAQKPAQIAAVPSEVVSGVDRATSGVILPCPVDESGCTPATTTPVPQVDVAPPTGPDGGNVPVVAQLVTASASDATQFLARYGVSTPEYVRRALADAVARGRVFAVFYLEDPKDTFNSAMTRTATFRFGFPGLTQLTLASTFHPSSTSSASRAVETSIAIAGETAGVLDGADVVPVDVSVVPSPNATGGTFDKGSSGTQIAGTTQRAFTSVVNDTLSRHPGFAFVRETAMFVKQADVAAQMGNCVQGEDTSGCAQPNDAPPPAFDAGFRTDGGRIDGGADAGPDAGGDAGALDGGLEVPDGGFPRSQTEHATAALFRLFPTDRFVTRLTNVAPPSAFTTDVTVRLGDGLEGAGPTYRNCPEDPSERGCVIAAGPTSALLAFAAVGLLVARRRR